MSGEPLVRLFVVELCYAAQKCQGTGAHDPLHLQVRARADEVLWHTSKACSLWPFTSLCPGTGTTLPGSKRTSNTWTKLSARDSATFSDAWRVATSYARA